MLMLEIHFVDSYRKSSGELKLNSEIKKTLFGDCGKKGRKKRGGGEENEKRRKGINSIRKGSIQL